MISAGADDPLPDVRTLARQGRIAAHMRAASPQERRRLSGQAYSIVAPLVFMRLTRGFENKRGHPRCASSIHRMEPQCLDRFHDDVEAVLEYLFRNAKQPIDNLEAWLTTWLGKAAVDAHRRRRGERGAPQRPRVPAWLRQGLGHEERLISLAGDILVWVGVDATAGQSVWPLTAWAHRRSGDGDVDRAERAVANDVETVLSAMRRRPEWYAKYVERPLGRKQAPVAGTPRADADSPSEPDYLALVEAWEIDEARLHELVATAIDVIDRRLTQGDDPRTVVVDVLTTVFAEDTGLGSFDQPPGHDSDLSEVLAARLANSAAIDQIVAAVLELLKTRG